MEVSDHGFLEELLALRGEPWETIPSGTNEVFGNGWGFDYCFDKNPASFLPSNSSLQAFSAAFESGLGFGYDYGYSFNETYNSFEDEFSRPQVTDSFYTKQDTSPFPTMEEEEEEEQQVPAVLHPGGIADLQSAAASGLQAGGCKVEPVQSAGFPIFDVGLCGDVNNGQQERPCQLH